MEKLPKDIRGKLKEGERLINNERRILVECVAAQLMQKFESPGSCGATAQWCNKLVAQFSVLADPGSSLGRKTVKMQFLYIIIYSKKSLRESIRQRIAYVQRLEKKSLVAECSVVDEPSGKSSPIIHDSEAARPQPALLSLFDNPDAKKPKVLAEDSDYLSVSYDKSSSEVDLAEIIQQSKNETSHLMVREGDLILLKNILKNNF